MKFLVFLFSIIIFSSSVVALITDEAVGVNYCSSEDINDFKTAFVTQDFSADFNGDGLINLVDVSLFTKDCYEKPEVVKSVVNPVKSSSINVVKEKDGSYTYRSNSRTIQHINTNMIVKNPDGFVGTVAASYEGISYNIGFFPCYDYNCVNVREVVD